MLAWAEAEWPDVAPFIVSNFLSDPAKDYLDTYRRNNRPAFKIRCWERPQLARMLHRKMALQRKYDLADIPIRSVKQILAAENEFFTRVWYGREMLTKVYRAEGTPEDIVKAMLKGMLEAEKRFGKVSLMANMKTD